MVKTLPIRETDHLTDVRIRVHATGDDTTPRSEIPSHPVHRRNLPTTRPTSFPLATHFTWVGARSDSYRRKEKNPRRHHRLHVGGAMPGTKACLDSSPCLKWNPFNPNIPSACPSVADISPTSPMRASAVQDWISVEAFLEMLRPVSTPACLSPSPHRYQPGSRSIRKPSTTLKISITKTLQKIFSASVAHLQ